MKFLIPLVLCAVLVYCKVLPGPVQRLNLHDSPGIITSVIQTNRSAVLALDPTDHTYNVSRGNQKTVLGLLDAKFNLTETIELGHACYSRLVRIKGDHVAHICAPTPWGGSNTLRFTGIKLDKYPHENFQIYNLGDINYPALNSFLFTEHFLGVHGNYYMIGGDIATGQWLFNLNFNTSIYTLMIDNLVATIGFDDQTTLITAFEMTTDETGVIMGLTVQGGNGSLDAYYLACLNLTTSQTVYTALSGSVLNLGLFRAYDMAGNSTGWVAMNNGGTIQLAKSNVGPFAVDIESSFTLGTFADVTFRTAKDTLFLGGVNTTDNRDYLCQSHGGIFSADDLFCTHVIPGFISALSTDPDLPLILAAYDLGMNRNSTGFLTPLREYRYN